MGYKVQFDNGHTVEFDSQPSDADIDEAYAHTKSVGFNPASQIPDSTPMPGSGPEYDPENYETPLDTYVRGPIEAAAQLGTGAISGAIAPIVGLSTGKDIKDADKRAGEFMQEYTYAPRGSAGQRYGEKIGKVINDVGIPMLGHGKIPSIKVSEAINATKARMPTKAVVEAPKTGVGALTEALLKEDPTPVVTEAPRPGLELSKEAYQQALREKELQRQSAFNRPDELGQLERQAPMERMASELGAEKPAAPIATDPMARMARDLEATPEQRVPAREAQKVLDERKALQEYEVQRQTALDLGAAERARQESAPLPAKQTVEKWYTGSPEPLLKTRSLEEQSRRSNAEQQKAGPGHYITQSEDLAGVYGGPTGKLYSIEAPYTKPFDLNTKGNEALYKKLQEVLGSKSAANVSLKEQGFDAITFTNNKGERIANVFNEVPVKEVGPARATTKVPKELTLSPKGTPFNFKKQSGGLLMDWKGKQDSSKFSNIPGVKNTLRDIGNSMIRTPEEAVSLAQKFGDVSQNVVQRSVGLLTKGGTYLKGKVNNPVVHYTVDKFLTAEGKARAEINTKLNQEYLPALRSLSKAEYKDAFQLLNAADLAQKAITPELMQQHGLSTKLQQFITTHQALMGEVLGKINDARAAVGKKPITGREAYSAMSMAGDYRKVAYKNIDGVKTVVGVIGADRKAGKLGWTLEKIEKTMLAKDPSIEFGPLQDTTHSRGSTKGTPHEAFQDALATIGENNPHVQQFLDTLKEVAKDDPTNYMGMQTHTMQKKGVWGMEGRKPWMDTEKNATQFFENQLKYIEGAYNWSHLSEAARDVNAVIRHPDVVGKQTNAIKMSESYMQNALGLNPSRVGRAVNDTFNAIGDALNIGPSNIRTGVSEAKSLANTWMLSLNPSFLAIQLVQGPASIPAMTALLRGRGLAPKSTILSQGLGHMAEAGMTLMKDQTGGKLSSVERGALNYAKENHIYSTDMVEHSNQTTKGGGYYWTKVTQSPAALIESGTRAQVYMTFVKMMDESGLTVKDGLYEQAHRLTDQAMNNYSAMEKPPIYSALGPIGSIAYNLKSFGHNEISRWSMLAREIPTTGNATPLLTQMATTIAIAGAMGLPFYSQWESLYDYITKKLGKPRSLVLDTMEASKELTKNLGEDWKHVISNGLPSVLGADVSKRIGLGDVLPSNAADAAFAGGGKLADVVSSTYGAVTKPDEAHLKAAAVATAPPIIASILKEKWYTKGDKSYSQDPDKPTKVTAQLTTLDKTLKKIGITGINESVQKQTNYQLKKLDKTYQDYRDRAMINITHDLYTGKPISEDDITKYFVMGQGDPATFENQINSAIEGLNLTPAQIDILSKSVSPSITKALSLQRRVEAMK